MGNYSGMTYKAPKSGLCDPSKLIPEITDEGVNDLLSLAEIVINTHFTYITDQYVKEDMMGSALCKMIEVINSGMFDPTRGSLKNILYTAARNECKNVVYRNSRSTPVSDEVMAINESKDLQVSFDKIEIDVDEYFLPKKADKEKIKSNLKCLGFIVDTEDNKYYPEMERWTTYVIWKKLR